MGGAEEDLGVTLGVVSGDDFGDAFGDGLAERAKGGILSLFVTREQRQSAGIYHQNN